MIYYELVEKSISNRDNIVRFTELSNEVRDYPAFASMFGFGDEIQKWVKLNGGVKGYNGTFHLQTFYFDIDCKGNLPKAKTHTIKLIKYLYNNYEVDPENLVVYFSGNKGFHLGMVDKLFGKFEPSKNLPAQVERLAKVLKPKGLTTLDMGIYNANRIFRLPNSLHKETGLYKIPLTLEELKLSAEEIQELATKPRPNFTLDVNYNDIVVNGRLKTAWEHAQHNVSDEKVSESLKDSLNSGNFFKPPTDGNRNNTLFKQACALFDQGMRSGDVFDIIKSINNSANPPIENKKEIYTIVKSAQDRTGSGETATTSSKVVSDMVTPYINYLSPSRKKLGLLFDSFSEDVKWKLRGKLIAVAGREGTKKSVFCQNMAYKNMRQFGTRSILSNMEMGENPLMSRLIDRTFSEYQIRPSEDMERAMKEGKQEWVRERLDAMSKHYGDKLIINSKSAMVPDDYKKLLKEEEADKGKVDFLFVDGFSMMGGKSSDRFSNQEVNSRELKEIAKDFDVCVVAIFHTNKSCEKYWRKPHEYIRGTNKQLDNVDAFISLSLLVDEANSTHENDLQYLEDVGYGLFYNKRGSGRILRSIYKFDSDRLRMKETKLNPHDFEVNVSRIGNSKF